MIVRTDYIPSIQNPLAVRIESHSLIYGFDRPFAEFWLQTDSTSKITAIIGRLDDSMTVALLPDADVEEIAAFCRIHPGIRTLCCPNELGVLLDSPCTEGYILRYNGKSVGHDVSAKQLSIREIYEIIAHAYGEASPKFNSFYADCCYRKNRCRLTSVGISKDGKPVATALTVAETDTAVIIGGVAVVPGFQNRGYGTKVVQALLTMLPTQNKKTYLFANINIADNFYSKLEFVYDNSFAEVNLST